MQSPAPQASWCQRRLFLPEVISGALAAVASHPCPRSFRGSLVRGAESRTWRFVARALDTVFRGVSSMRIRPLLHSQLWVRPGGPVGLTLDTTRPG